MSLPHHHASDETLLQLAAGTLAEGPRIVVSAHLEACAHCRARKAELEAIGGAVLEDSALTPLSPDALARVLARIDSGEEREPPACLPEAHIGDFALPDSLRGLDIGRWRWLAPGLHLSRLRSPHDPEAGLYLLKARPGSRLPGHGHAGTEFTCILAGAYTDRFGRFGPGDLAEMDHEAEHQPIVDPGADCICLIAQSGPMRFRGFVERTLQPFFGV